MLNFSIAYGKTAKGLAQDWSVTVDEAKKKLLEHGIMIVPKLNHGRQML